jgi:pyrroloquinoline-quinone synthase
VSPSAAEIAIEALVDDVLRDVDVAENPYFRHLADGSFGKDDFFETQLQFHSAVVFFNRPMAALAARIPTAELRLQILKNVWEEHGEGDLTKSHGATFITFLSRLAQRPEPEIEAELARRPLWPEVRIFNTLLAGTCVLDEYLVGAGTLGIVERMFSGISARIGATCVARGFLPAEQMIHYDLHEKLDVRHAADFFAVLADGWTRGEKARYEIEQGLRMGATAFDQLYARLYRSRARRRTR